MRIVLQTTTIVFSPHRPSRRRRLEAQAAVDGVRASLNLQLRLLATLCHTVREQQ